MPIHLVPPVWIPDRRTRVRVREQAWNIYQAVHEFADTPAEVLKFFESGP